MVNHKDARLVEMQEKTKADLINKETILVITLLKKQTTKNGSTTLRTDE